MATVAEFRDCRPRVIQTHGFPNMETLRIVLVGKTGAGKSCLGNALTGLEEVKINFVEEKDRPRAKSDDCGKGFKVGRGMNSQTKYCDRRKTFRPDSIVELEVIDTPGLCDTELDDENIHRELAKSIAVAEPGPHVIIFVAKCGKFTKEERDAYNTIKLLFSEELNNYLILVFTALDNFREDEKSNESLEELRDILSQELRRLGDHTGSMLKDASNRYLGMMLKFTDKGTIDRQVMELISMIKDLVRLNGPRACYSSALTEEIREKVDDLARQRAGRQQDLKEQNDPHACYSSALTEEIREKVDDLARQRVGRQQGVPQEEVMTQALDEVKEDIITEDVDLGFLEWITSAAAMVCSKVKDGVKKMCSVM